MQKAALYTSGAFFTIGAIAHIVRLASGFDIVIDGISFPVWVSLPAAIAATLLAIWMVTAARRT